MKRLKNILMVMLMLFPSVVFASSGENTFPVGMALGMEAFVSIHMSVFVLIPLSKIISKENNKKTFWILFGIRAAFLIFCDFFITPAIAVVDFIAVFIGAFLIVPISAAITKTPINARSNQVITNNTIGANMNPNPPITGGVLLKCANCGADLQVTDKFCTACGTPFDGNNVQVVQDTSPVVPFDTKYYASEKVILKNMIIEEIKNQGEDAKLLSTGSLNKKKNILIGIFGVLTLISAILFYFNYSIGICALIEIIGLFIFWIISKRFNVVNILIKNAIKNPDEDISRLVNNIRSEKQTVLLPNFLKLVIVVFAAVFIPTITFFNPKVIYTRYGDGYQVFKYTRGITSSEEVIIPSTYKGKNVIAIGESAFQNSNVKKVILPKGIESIKTKAFYNANQIERIDIPTTVIEIRAEAFAYMDNLTYISLPKGLKDIRAGVFAYDTNLTNVTLPSTLEYLGASAFSHCSSITEITIPKGVTEINGQTFEYMTSLKTINMHDDITFIHGEVFVGDTNLNNVTLPSKITEIRGNTFENCSSLTSIKIPDGVTRIGGHAFYGCTSLSYVYVPKSVTEIGSSAFRQCYSLRSITIPRNAVVNERAFKESPTSISYYNY